MKKYLDKIEIQIEKWLEPIPNLPASWRKWLAGNAWWIVLVGVAIAAISAIASLVTVFSFGYYPSYIYYAGYYTGGWYSWHILTTVVSVAFMLAIVVINAVAIKDLKNMKQKGWKLLFLSFLVGILSEIVSILLNFNFFSFIASLIFLALGAAISGYVLFQLKAYFDGVKVIEKKKK